MSENFVEYSKKFVVSHIKMNHTVMKGDIIGMLKGLSGATVDENNFLCTINME